MQTNNFCLYCFTSDELTESHWIPRCIGGWYWDYVSCGKCNSLIGHSIEGSIKKDVFFATGIAELGLQNRQHAFRDIIIRDSDSGERLIYDGDRLVGAARKPEGGKRVAPPRILRRNAIRDVERRFPHLRDEYVRALDAGQNVISVGNEEHFFYVEEKKIKTEFISTGTFPMDLLAKICYEGAWHLQQFLGRCLQDFYRSTFVIMGDYETGPTSIGVDPSFKRRVICLSPRILQNKTSLDAVPYKAHHRVDYRISKKGVCYARIEFFGVLPFVVAMGMEDSMTSINEKSLSKALFLGVETDLIRLVDYPESVLKTIPVQDVLAELAWNRFSE